jgi:hypothetical protein
VGVTWKGATDGGGATNQFCTVGHADLREPGTGADDPEILLLGAAASLRVASASLSNAICLKRMLAISIIDTT